MPPQTKAANHWLRFGLCGDLFDQFVHAADVSQLAAGDVSYFLQHIKVSRLTSLFAVLLLVAERTGWMAEENSPFSCRQKSRQNFGVMLFDADSIVVYSRIANDFLHLCKVRLHGRSVLPGDGDWVDKQRGRTLQIDKSYGPVEVDFTLCQQVKNSDVVSTIAQILKTAAQSFRISEQVRDVHHECSLSNFSAT